MFVAKPFSLRLDIQDFRDIYPTCPAPSSNLTGLKEARKNIICLVSNQYFTNYVLFTPALSIPSSFICSGAVTLSFIDCQIFFLRSLSLECTPL